MLTVLLATQALGWAGASGNAMASVAEKRAEAQPSEQRAETRTFSYYDEELLFPWQQRSSAVYIPSKVEQGAKVPLIVFLHGINGEGILRMWMGGGNRDLRPHWESLAKETPKGLIVAAPSQSRNASLGSRLWSHFDLASFVKATDEALGDRTHVDTTQVIVVGHSGAGCNLEGGIASIALGSMHPMAIVPVDTCLDEELGKVLAQRPPQRRLWVFWQDRSWPRHAQAFRQAVEENQAPGAWFQMDRIVTEERNPHEAILPIALNRVVRKLLVESGS